MLISIDTLRADHLGLYGYSRPTSPGIDAFAEQAVVFEDASSTSPWTLPAHASLFSGRYPEHHRLTSFERRLPLGVETIAARLTQLGFDTRAVVNTHLLTNRFGLDYGFAKLKYVEEALVRVSPSTWVTDQAMEWIAEPRERPMFLFMHYYDVHSDYASLPRYRERFERPYEGEIDGSTLHLKEFRHGVRSIDARDADHLIDLYDAGVRQTDEEIDRLFAFLHERGELDTSLVVLTSDHGEEFLEHGSVLHGASQYAEVLRVPLILRYPPVLPPLRVRSPVSLVDVVPTILGLLGEAPMDGIDGLDLSPLWNDPNAETILGFDQRALFTSADQSTTALDSGSVSEGAPVELTDAEKELIEALGYGTQ
ncbi:MAG: sulfatase [Myxococcota bacterium]